MKRSDDAFMDAQTIIDALSADQLAAAFGSVEREQAVDHLANERTAWERRGLSEEVMRADSESADAAVRGEAAIHALYSRHARFYRVGIMSAAFLAACFAVLLVAAVLIPAEQTPLWVILLVVILAFLCVLTPVLVAISIIFEFRARSLRTAVLLDWAARREGQLARGVPNLAAPEARTLEHVYLTTHGYVAGTLFALIACIALFTYPLTANAPVWVTVPCNVAAVACGLAALGLGALAVVRPTREANRRMLLEALAGGYETTPE